MVSMPGIRKNALVLMAVTCTAVLGSAPAWAQETPATAPAPNAGAVTVTGSYDVVNPYMFRGIRQNFDGVAMWPALDLGFSARQAKINVGTWNSVHTGDGLAWYEGDFYATVGFAAGGVTSLSATYTAYNSPHSSFTNVNEFAFKVAVNDSGRLGKAALSPYVLLAQEFNTDPGQGQADGGEHAGTYLELGVSPAHAMTRATLAFPIKVGVSLNDYYELNGRDNGFGFFSAGGLLTVPLGGATSFGAWNLHGGVEYQALGTTTKFYNNGHGNRVIGSFGVGFSY
jgi:hypothetical protein